ncbi:hypothetical protein COY95_02400 [Candidatus Woesearchaeota archaeon CG_4_10_14_0_8_um_filter_47_5]|nr:MAG: hypothetical protein COY95_02400 [Candidatus Woesearchaeota archaeon CG_4_10_14_0_8_um_filter_47_5]
MDLFETFRTALGNIRNRRLRSWLTIMGIIIGIGAVVALTSLSSGLENAIVDQFNKMGKDFIRIYPANLQGPPAGDIGIQTSDAEFIAKIKGVDYISPNLIQYAAVTYDNTDAYVMVAGYDSSIAERNLVETDFLLEEGRYIRPGEKYNAIVGYSVAHGQFDKDISIRNSIEINGVKFRVVGIFNETGTFADSRVVIPLDVARELFNKPDLVNVVSVKILPGEDLTSMAALIKDKLSRRRNKDDFEVSTPDELLRQFNSILGLVQAILVGIAAISLVVGGIGIMNSMFTSVLERTNEIGVMKAIGARNNDILTIFLIESGIIGLIGGSLGIVIGEALSFGVARVAKLAGFGLLRIEVNPVSVLFVLLFAFGIGMVSGAVPALRAARLRPVDALRYE